MREKERKQRDRNECLFLMPSKLKKKISTSTPPEKNLQKKNRPSAKAQTPRTRAATTAKKKKKEKREMTGLARTAEGVQGQLLERRQRQRERRRR